MKNSHEQQAVIDIGDFYDVPVTIVWHWENDGIGSYEYWGAKCFDYGHDYPEIDDILIDGSYSDDKISDLNDFIDNNFEAICDKIADDNLLSY